MNACLGRRPRLEARPAYPPTCDVHGRDLERQQYVELRHSRWPQTCPCIDARGRVRSARSGERVSRIRLAGAAQSAEADPSAEPPFTMRAARRTNHVHTLESGLCLVLKSKAAALRVGRSPTRSLGSMALSITPYGLQTLESAENGNGGLVQKLGVHEASERRPLGLGLSIYERFGEGFPPGAPRRPTSAVSGRRSVAPGGPEIAWLGSRRGGEASAPVHILRVGALRSRRDSQMPTLSCPRTRASMAASVAIGDRARGLAPGRWIPPGLPRGSRGDDRRDASSVSGPPPWQPTSACGAPLWMKMVAARADLSEPSRRAIVSG